MNLPLTQLHIEHIVAMLYMNTPLAQLHIEHIIAMMYMNTQFPWGNIELDMRLY